MASSPRVLSEHDEPPNSSERDGFASLLSDIAHATPRDPLLLGRPLAGTTFGHYRVLDELGRGGMGIVYHAQDTRLGRDVALKVLPFSTAADGDERRRRLQREARAAAAIVHPNLVTVYEVGDVDGRAFFAMERIEGSTLRAHLARGRLETSEAVRIARQMARGMASAHAKGITHRDLKPENVMITRDGDVKILDFGLAKLRDPNSGDDAPPSGTTITQEGRVLGTPGYMSPEQATGKPTDPRTDLYAFGTVLHEILTGELPGALGSGEVVKDPQLAAIITRCLARRPEERCSAQDVVAALDAAADSVASKTAKRTGSWVALVGVAALVAAAAVVAVISRSGGLAKSPVPQGPSSDAAPAVVAGDSAMPTTPATAALEPTTVSPTLPAPADPRLGPLSLPSPSTPLTPVPQGSHQGVPKPRVERPIATSPGF